MPSLRKPRDILGTTSVPGSGSTASVWCGQRAGNHSTSPGCSTASYGDESASTSPADKSSYVHATTGKEVGWDATARRWGACRVSFRRALIAYEPWGAEVRPSGAIPCVVLRGRDHDCGC